MRQADRGAQRGGTETVHRDRWQALREPRRKRSPPRHITHALMSGVHATHSDVVDVVEGNPGTFSRRNHRQAQQVIEPQVGKRPSVPPERRTSPCHHISTCRHARTVIRNGPCRPNPLPMRDPSLPQSAPFSTRHEGSQWTGQSVVMTGCVPGVDRRGETR